MAGKHEKLRVALFGPDLWPSMLPLIQGVMMYNRRAQRWDLRGTASRPVVKFSELDPTETDGVIGFFYERHWADILNEAGVAAVDVASQFGDLPVCRVGPDNQAIGRMGAEHLLACGFPHFAFFGRGSRWGTQQRLAGFEEVIGDVTGRPCHVFRRADHDNAEGHPVDNWLKQLPKPVAVMAAGDEGGRLLIERASDLGLQVPDDVAALGVNNDLWLTELATVPMSSIEGNGREVGFQAAKRLDQLMAGERHTRPYLIPPVGVVTRRSTDIVLTDDPVVGRAMGYIRDHCHEGISVDDVLEQLEVSRRTLETHLKRKIGRTPQAAIFSAQVERAKKMLVETEEPMYRIAEACGFDGQSRFSIVFKREVGMAPSEYRLRFGAIGK